MKTIGWKIVCAADMMEFFNDALCTTEKIITEPPPFNSITLLRKESLPELTEICEFIPNPRTTEILLIANFKKKSMWPN